MLIIHACLPQPRLQSHITEGSSPDVPSHGGGIMDSCESALQGCCKAVSCHTLFWCQLGVSVSAYNCGSGQRADGHVVHYGEPDPHDAGEHHGRVR